MAGAPAYRYDTRRYDSYRYRTYGTAAPKPAPERRPDITVIPGRAPRPSLDPRIHVVIRVIVAVTVILMLAGLLRVGFASAATTANIAHEELSMQVNAARAEGGELEVQASNLSNPAYVREYASSKLGMQAPLTVETMTLGEDVVVVDEDGALSLSGSLAAVARG